MATPRQVPQQPMSNGLRGELVGILVGELDFTHDEARAIDPKIFRRDFREFLMKYRPARRLPSALISWGATYQRLFGKVPDLSKVIIPPKPKGVGPVRLVVVAEEIVEWSKKFDPRFHLGLQMVLADRMSLTYGPTDVVDERDVTQGSYAVWVRDVRDADQSFILAEDNKWVADRPGMTLVERLLLEADYYFETRDHLDYDHPCVCIGSKISDSRSFAAVLSKKYAMGTEARDVKVGWVDMAIYQPLYSPPRYRQVWA